MTKAAIGPSKSKSDQDIELSSQLVAWAEGGRLKASPLARRLAQEAGLELSGTRGRVVGS